MSRDDDYEERPRRGRSYDDDDRDERPPPRKSNVGIILAIIGGVLLLVAGAGVFVGLNTMFGAVAGRVRELGTLQVVGFLRRAILLSLMQESVLLAAAATLAAAAIALPLAHGFAVRFTMGAFPLRIDGFALLAGCAVGLGLGLLGAVPPALRALRLEIVEALKSI